MHSPLLSLALVIAARPAPCAGPEALPPDVKSGLSCSFSHCEVTARATFSRTEAPVVQRGFQVGAMLTVPADGPPCMPLDLVVTELKDERGESLLPGEAPQRPALNRSNVASNLSHATIQERREQSHWLNGYVHLLSTLPRGITSCRATAAAVCATATARKTITLEAQEDAIQLCEGVRLIITQAESRGDQFVLSYEVHTRRDRDTTESNPQLSPLFVGLAFRNAEGRADNILRHGEEIETRDEYILVVKDVQMDAAYYRQFKSVEAVVLEKVEIVTFEVGAQGIDLSANPSPR